MPAPRKSPLDVTGRKAVELAQENAEALKAREGELSLLNAAADAEKQETVDLTASARPTIEVVEETEVEVSNPIREFRVNTTLENVTIGHGNTFHFEEGRKYRASKHVYDHLEERGLIWH